MLKKIVIVLAVAAVAAVIALNVLARKSPDLLRAAIEKSLKKPVVIGAIQYRFPGTFFLEGFEIKENAPFAGETSFYAERITMHASAFSFTKRELMIDKIEVNEPSIVVRKYRGRFLHALSDAARDTESVPTAQGEGAAAPAATLPLEIREFRITNGRFQYIDYDVREGGFVIGLEAIEAAVKNIAVPYGSKRTRYSLEARMPQGRDQKNAEVRFSGWSQFRTRDTDASLQVSGAYLPYFAPYYRQVTAAAIEDGTLDTRASLQIQSNELTCNMDFELTGLLFGAYENGNQLFGLNAEEILSFLRDRAGRLKFQVAVGWNITDRSVKPRDVIRRGIERSLKATVIGNVGNILEKALLRVGEGGEKGITTSKDEVEGVLKKMKDLFRG